MSDTLLDPGAIPRCNVSVSLWTLCVRCIGPLFGTWCVFPCVYKNPTFTKSCGRSSALSIASLLSRSISRASHTIIPANGFTYFPHALSLHCSRTSPGTQKPTYPIGTDRTARPRSSRSYSSTGLALASYRTSRSSGS